MIPCSKGLWFYEIVYSSGGGVPTIEDEAAGFPRGAERGSWKGEKTLSHISEADGEGSRSSV